MEKRIRTKKIEELMEKCNLTQEEAERCLFLREEIREAEQMISLFAVTGYGATANREKNGDWIVTSTKSYRLKDGDVRYHVRVRDGKVVAQWTTTIKKKSHCEQNVGLDWNQSDYGRIVC